MMEVPTCASVEGVLSVASVVGSLFYSPCTYTGFSEVIVRPQLTPLHVPALSLAPSTILRARRKKIGGFSRKFCALAVANGHLRPGVAQYGLCPRADVSRVVTAIVETPPSCVPFTVPLMEMGHKFERVVEARMFPYLRRTGLVSTPLEL